MNSPLQYVRLGLGILEDPSSETATQAAGEEGGQMEFSIGDS